MARFCSGCGAQAASDEVKSCEKCGTALPAPSGTTGSPASAASGRRSSGPWAKIILAVVAFFGFVAVASLGTCVYIGYRVKKKVEAVSSEYGLDKLRDLSPASTSSPVEGREVCSLLSKEEVGEATGVTITDAHGSTSECTYASATNPTVAQSAVTWQGGATAFKLAIVSVKMTSGGQGIVKLSGIGDEAWTVGLEGRVKEEFRGAAKDDPLGLLKGMTNMLGQFPLMFRKGDVMASVGVSEAPDMDEAKKALATKLASRL